MKDISDLFKEAEQQLSERPSPRAWGRLERRLDDRKRDHRRGLYRQLMAAAAVLLLLLFATIGLFMMQQVNEQYASATPIQLEELTPPFHDETASAQKVVTFTRQHVNRLANPVDEGKPNKRLKPKVQ